MTQLFSGHDIQNVRPYTMGSKLVIVPMRQPWATLTALGFKRFVVRPDLSGEKPVIREGTWLAFYAPRVRVSVRVCRAEWDKLHLIGKPGIGMFPTGVIVAIARIAGFPNHLEAGTDPTLEDPLVHKDSPTTLIELKDIQSLWHPLRIKKPRHAKVLADYDTREAVEKALRPADWIAAR